MKHLFLTSMAVALPCLFLQPAYAAVMLNGGLSHEWLTPVALSVVYWS